MCGDYILSARGICNTLHVIMIPNYNQNKAIIRHTCLVIISLDFYGSTIGLHLHGLFNCDLFFSKSFVLILRYFLTFSLNFIMFICIMFDRRQGI